MAEPPRRPEHPFPAPPGRRWEVVASGPDWKRLIGQRCRYTVGPNHQSCKRPSVMGINRGRTVWGDKGQKAYTVDSWWGYCDLPEHMFGHWIEAGAVVSWVLREVDEEAS